MFTLNNIFNNKKVQSNTINKDITVILDPGHGIETLGKRSPKWPDGSQLFEYEFNRDIVNRIAEDLERSGIKCVILVPEKNDISLSERVKRANKIWKNTGKKCFGISIHANAGGGTGFEVYTSVGKTKSDDIATVSEIKMVHTKRIGAAMKSWYRRYAYFMKCQCSDTCVSIRPSGDASHRRRPHRRYHLTSWIPPHGGSRR